MGTKKNKKKRKFPLKFSLHNTTNNNCGRATCRTVKKKKGETEKKNPLLLVNQKRYLQ